MYYINDSCTCIRAWLLHALSKQSCKAIVRERAYSDSICTIDVTPWGLASLACVFREIGHLRKDFHCARAVRRLLKSEKCTSDKKIAYGEGLGTRLAMSYGALQNGMMGRPFSASVVYGVGARFPETYTTVVRVVARAGDVRNYIIAALLACQ